MKVKTAVKLMHDDKAADSIQPDMTAPYDPIGTRLSTYPAEYDHDDNVPGTAHTYNYVNHPSHYNNYDTEVLAMMEKIWGKDAAALWCEMTAFKYRMRMGTKPGEPIERDMDKENFYLNEYSKRNPKHLPITVIIEDNEG